MACKSKIDEAIEDVLRYFKINSSTSGAIKDRIVIRNIVYLQIGGKNLSDKNSFIYGK